MTIRLSAPSKTFLLGEYAVLNQSGALLLSTKPRFAFSATTRGKAYSKIFHPKSPAGKFIKHNEDLLSGLDLQFNDPYEGGGGFGASSAQFALSYVLCEALRSTEGLQSIKLQDLWTSYRALFLTSSGRAPSGADVISQVIGGVTYFKESPWKCQSLQWPFENLDFFIIRTGFKVETHNHLKEISDMSFESLGVIFEKAFEAFKSQNQDVFLDSVNEYQEELFSRELTLEDSKELIEALRSTDCIKAVKGCGAMGADTVLLLFDSKDTEKVKDRLSLLDRKVVSSKADLTSGLRFRLDSQAERKELSFI